MSLSFLVDSHSVTWTVGHAEPLDKAHAAADDYVARLKALLPGPPPDLQKTGDGFIIEVTHTRGQDFSLDVFATMAAYPADLHGRGVRWGGP